MSASTPSSSSAATILVALADVPHRAQALLQHQSRVLERHRPPRSSKISSGFGITFRRSKRATATCWKAPTPTPPLWPTQWEKIAIGGSDAHALASVGTAYTEVPGRAKQGRILRRRCAMGQGRVAGESGCFIKLTRDVFSIGFEMMRENSWTRSAAPLALLVPAFTYLNYCSESTFRRRWARAGSQSAAIPRSVARWIAVPQPAVEESI